MTREEIEEGIFKYRYYIADRIKDIQIFANSMKNVEDIPKNKQTLLKISDAIADIRNSYGELEELLYTEPDDEWFF